MGIPRGSAFDPAIAAAEVAFTPAGGVAATNVQAAIEEVDAEKVAKVASTDNAIVRFDGAGGAVQNSGATIDDNNHLTAYSFTSHALTMADDSAASFEIPGGVNGMLVAIQNNSTIVPRPIGLFWVRGGAGPQCANVAMISTTNITFTTGALSGTTGTDGNITLSAHTNSRFYIENRKGSSQVINLTFLCTQP